MQHFLVQLLPLTQLYAPICDCILIYLDSPQTFLKDTLIASCILIAIVSRVGGFNCYYCLEARFGGKCLGVQPMCALKMTSNVSQGGDANQVHHQLRQRGNGLTGRGEMNVTTIVTQLLSVVNVVQTSFYLPKQREDLEPFCGDPFFILNMECPPFNFPLGIFSCCCSDGHTHQQRIPCKPLLAKFVPLLLLFFCRIWRDRYASLKTTSMDHVN